MSNVLRGACSVMTDRLLAFGALRDAGELLKLGCQLTGALVIESADRQS